MRGYSTIGCLLTVATLLSPQGAGAQSRWGRPTVPRDGACFYRDQNFAGEYFCTVAGQDIASLRGMDDEITSIKVFGNVQVTLFREERFKGRSAALQRDIRNVGDAWNDKISSISVRSAYGRDRDAGRYDDRDDRNRDRDRNGDGAGDRNGNGTRDRNGDRERNNRITNQQAEAMVARAYRRLLGRDPDPSSRSWVDLIQRNNWTEQQLADEIMKSAEYQAQHSRGRQRQRR
jgi:hypothetical protein